MQSVCTVTDLIHVGVLLVEKAVKGIGTCIGFSFEILAQKRSVETWQATGETIQGP